MPARIAWPGGKITKSDASAKLSAFIERRLAKGYALTADQHAAALQFGIIASTESPPSAMVSPAAICDQVVAKRTAAH